MLNFIDISLLYKIIFSVVAVAASYLFLKVFNRVLFRIVGEKTADRKRIVGNVQRFFQLVVYSVAAVLILWTFEVDVTGLLAGLGIGALVIGFALKDVIENWVSGLLIFSGKTYKIGDVIQVGSLKGVVTAISLRTTVLKTYDRNEIIIPNSVLLKEKIINLTGGGTETVTSIIFYTDYVFSAAKTKALIEAVLRNHPNIVVDEERKREIRFLVRNKEWVTEVEPLFWINDPEREEFIKSQIAELVKKKFEEEKILPPIPSIIRKEFLEPRT